MNITNLPVAKVFDDNPSVRIFLSQLVDQLQEFFSDERYKFPTQNTLSITHLNGIDNNIGTVLYNETSKTVQVNTDEVYKPLATYEELTAAQVSAIPAVERNGRFIFETDTGDLRVGMNNLFKTVTVT